jgi:hypothetical protein
MRERCEALRYRIVRKILLFMARFAQHLTLCQFRFATSSGKRPDFVGVLQPRINVVEAEVVCRSALHTKLASEPFGPASGPPLSLVFAFSFTSQRHVP